MLSCLQIFMPTRFKWRAELKRSRDRDKARNQAKFRELIVSHDTDLVSALRNSQKSDRLKQLADEVCSSSCCMTEMFPDKQS
jgi:hypothetical protein